MSSLGEEGNSPSADLERCYMRQTSKKCEENASHPTCCIGFAGLQGTAPPSPLHLRVLLKTACWWDTRGSWTTIRRQYWMWHLSCFFCLGYPFNKPPSFFEQNQADTLSFKPLLHVDTRVSLTQIESYLNIYIVESGSSGVWGRKGTVSVFAAI